MARQLSIDFRVSGVPQVQRDLRQLADQARDIGQATRNVRGGGGGRRSADPLGQFVRSMRFGGGGGLGGMMPLVGRTLDLFGLGKAAGPIGIAIGALTAFTEGVKAATERLNELGAASAISGGTPGQVARLEAMGISPGQIAGRAAALRQHLSTDPQAMALASRAGVNTLPRPFGDPNEAKGFLRILEYLRSINDESEQLRQARVLGVEDLIPKLRVSEGVWQREKRVAQLQDQSMSKEATQAARDLAENTRLLGQAFSTLTTNVFTPLIKKVSDAVGWLTDQINKLNSPATASQQGWLGPLSPGSSMRRPGAPDPAQAQADAAKAQAAAAAAMGRLTEQMQGLFGGGARAKGALGAGWQGEFFRRAAMGQALRMGAFSL